MEPDEGRVFVCEGSDAWDDAQRLTAFLEARGIPVWLGWRDKGEISRPTDYFDARCGAACRCGAVILILSEDPADARDLRDLAGMAHARGRPIFPVLLSDKAPLSDFAEVMGERPWTSTFGADAEARLERLTEELRTVLGETASRSRAAADEASPAVVEAPPDDDLAPAIAAPEAELRPPLPFADVVPPPVEDGESERLLRAFVGPRADSYLARWQRLEAQESGPGWNWPAFLFSGLWFAFRKLWGSALLVVAVSVGLLAAVLLLPLHPAVAIGGAFLIALSAGLSGHRLYQRRADRAVAAVQTGHAGPHARMERLRRRGGVSFLAPILLAILWTGAAATVVLLAWPDRPICVGDNCVDGRWLRQTLARIDPVPTASTATATATAAAAVPEAVVPADRAISRDWVTGRWGVTGTRCRIWIDFAADGSLVDNLGGTGRWLFDTGTPETPTLTIITDRTGEPVPSRIERSGDNMIFGAGRAAWSRAGC
ncbi:MAG: DUF2628 domain-containing protein [Allosphingosinicella sp.]